MESSTAQFLLRQSACVQLPMIHLTEACTDTGKSMFVCLWLWVQVERLHKSRASPPRSAQPLPLPLPPHAAATSDALPPTASQVAAHG